MSVTMGCLPVSTFYFSESTSFLIRLVKMLEAINTPGVFLQLIMVRVRMNVHNVISVSLSYSNTDVELEIKDPDLLVVPSFCLGVPLEETPEGTVNSFLNEFM